MRAISVDMKVCAFPKKIAIKLLLNVFPLRFLTFFVTPGSVYHLQLKMFKTRLQMNNISAVNMYSVKITCKCIFRKSWVNFTLFSWRPYANVCLGDRTLRYWICPLRIVVLVFRRPGAMYFSREIILQNHNSVSHNIWINFLYVTCGGSMVVHQAIVQQSPSLNPVPIWNSPWQTGHSRMWPASKEWQRNNKAKRTYSN